MWKEGETARVTHPGSGRLLSTHPQTDGTHVRNEGEKETRPCSKNPVPHSSGDDGDDNIQTNRTVSAHSCAGRKAE